MDRTLARLLHFTMEKSVKGFRDRIFVLRRFFMDKVLGGLANYVREFEDILTKDEYQVLVRFLMDFEDMIEENLDELLSDVDAFVKKLDKITGFRK